VKHSLSRSLLAAAGGILFATAAFGQQPPPGAGVRPVVNPQAVAPQVAPDNGLGMAQLGARVGATGNLISGAGAVSSREFTSLGVVGGYEVIFNRNVTGCFYNAVSEDINVPAIAATQPRDATPNGVFLRFRDAAGTGRQTQFYLTVFCAR